MLIVSAIGTTSSPLPTLNSCKLCSTPYDDALHFIATCTSLQCERVRLLQNASSAVSAHLTDPITRLEEFSNAILGTCWIDHHELQMFCIEYLRELMDYPLVKLSIQ